MKAELKILMVEDDDNDAELILNRLREGGFAPCITRVETQADFVELLANDAPDIILSDHGLPGFNGFEALALANRQCPEVPFIFVTGLAETDPEIEILEKACIRYVLKNQISRLVPVVQQSLHDAVARRKIQIERERKVLELQHILDNVKILSGLLPICASCKKVRDYQGQWHPLEAYLREHSEATLTHEFCDDCATQIRPGPPQPVNQATFNVIEDGGDA